MQEGIVHPSRCVRGIHDACIFGGGVQPTPTFSLWPMVESLPAMAAEYAVWFLVVSVMFCLPFRESHSSFAASSLLGSSAGEEKSQTSPSTESMMKSCDGRSEALAALEKQFVLLS